MNSRNLLSRFFDRKHENPKSSGASVSLFSKSLVCSSQANRTSSVFNPRSTSEYKKSDSTSDNKFLPLIRVTHMLGIKVKKLSYFFFCKLENNLKEQRKKHPEMEIPSISSASNKNSKTIISNQMKANEDNWSPFKNMSIPEKIKGK